MNCEHATPELFTALAKAQGEIENAVKSSTNPHFKSKYADLAEVLTTIRDTLPKHGLSITQSPSFDGSLASVTTVIAHAGGGYLISRASCVPAKTDAQGIGAATTYLRRYSAAAMAGIAQEDDDGQSARHEGKPAPLTASPRDGVWESLNDTEKQAVVEITATVKEYTEMKDFAGAVDYLAAQGLGVEMKTAVWSGLSSAERSAIKKAQSQKEPS